MEVEVHTVPVNEPLNHHTHACDTCGKERYEIEKFLGLGRIKNALIAAIKAPGRAVGKLYQKLYHRKRQKVIEAVQAIASLAKAAKDSMEMIETRFENDMNRVVAQFAHIDKVTTSLKAAINDMPLKPPFVSKARGILDKFKNNTKNTREYITHGSKQARALLDKMSNDISTIIQNADDIFDLPSANKGAAEILRSLEAANAKWDQAEQEKKKLATKVIQQSKKNEAKLKVNPNFNASSWKYPGALRIGSSPKGVVHLTPEEQSSTDAMLESINQTQGKTLRQVMDSIG